MLSFFVWYTFFLGVHSNAGAQTHFINNAVYLRIGIGLKNILMEHM